MYTSLLKSTMHSIALATLIVFFACCSNSSKSIESFKRDHDKYEWLMNECNSGNYTVVSLIDTFSMIESEEDHKLKKCRARCTVLESSEAKEVNLKHFINIDTTVAYRDKIALIIFDVEETNYHDTVVVDRIYMTKNFNFYSSHQKKHEKDSIFYEFYAMLEPPKYVKDEDCGSFEFMFGIPFTKKIYGSTLLFYSAGYYSIGNNMINTLYGE